MKKLIILTSSYYPKIGGVEKHVRCVVKQLKKHYSITILVRYDVNVPSKQIVDGVTVLRLSRNLTGKKLILWLLRHPRLLSTRIVHSHDYYLHPLHKLLPKVKWVHTFHGFEDYPIRQSAIKERQRIRESVPICIGIGKFIEKWYKTPLNLILYGAIDQPKLSRRVDKKWDAIFFGRLEKDTGFAEYLKAFKKIAAKEPRAKLLVLGNGTLFNWANSFSDNNKLNVTFKRAVGNVLPYVQKAHVAFVSGYLGILEAASLKVPIVAYFNNPLKYDYLIMHPESNNMFIVGSIDKIVSSYDNARLAKNIKLDKIRGWAKKQTWQSITDQYMKIYES